MSKSITFSIVVPFFNESQKLPEVVKSLTKLNWPVSDYEVILVDNMSSDDSAEIAKICLSNFQNGRVIPCTDFRSSYAARNVGWRSARGQYIVFIDADCIADKNLLTGYDHAIKLDTTDEVGIFAGTIDPYCRETLTPVEIYSSKKKLLNQDSAVKGWAYRPFAQTANAAFPKKILEAVNGFNPHMTSGGDGELCWRIMDTTGKRITHCQDAKVQHWHRESLRDLFFQFEKYGIGRFQQSAVIKNFGKGLIGVSTETIVESLESLEKEISAKIPENQEHILEKLYDVVARVGNSIGYLGAKGLISNNRDEKNIFSSPRFDRCCSICKEPNPESIPTLKSEENYTNKKNECRNCRSTVETRIISHIRNLADSPIKEKSDPSAKKLTLDLINGATEIEHSGIYTTKMPGDFSSYLTIIRWARYKNKTVLITAHQETEETPWNSHAEINKNISHTKLSGFFFDGYTQSKIYFELI